METVSWMLDFLPVHLLAQAQVQERRFEDCLLACPREGEVIQVLEREVFTRLLEFRITSLLLALASLEAYLGYYAHQTWEQLSPSLRESTLHAYLESHNLLPFFKDLPARSRRRHELILEENGKRPLQHFLTRTPLSLGEKLLYFPLIRAKKMVSEEDGHVKKLFRLLALAEELTNPAFVLAPEIRELGSKAELKEVLLSHDLPEGITPGRSAAKKYVVEPYAEGHFFWELLHCYPPRVVQEVIQYLHLLDHSENHFLTVMRAVPLLNEEGEAVTTAEKKYVIEITI